MDRAKAHRLERGDQPSDLDMLDDLADVAMDSDEDSMALPPPTRGRGRGGRGRGARGRGRGEISCLRRQISDMQQLMALNSHRLSANDGETTLMCIRTYRREFRGTQNKEN